MNALLLLGDDYRETRRVKLKFVSGLIQIASLRFFKALEGSKITLNSVDYNHRASFKRAREKEKKMLKGLKVLK